MNLRGLKPCINGYFFEEEKRTQPSQSFLIMGQSSCNSTANPSWSNTSSSCCTSLGKALPPCWNLPVDLYPALPQPVQSSAVTMLGPPELGLCYKSTSTKELVQREEAQVTTPYLLILLLQFSCLIIVRLLFTITEVVPHFTQFLCYIPNRYARVCGLDLGAKLWTEEEEARPWKETPKDSQHLQQTPKEHPFLHPSPHNTDMREHTKRNVFLKVYRIKHKLKHVLILLRPRPTAFTQFSFLIKCSVSPHPISS